MVISVRGEPIWGLWALTQIMCLVIANYLFVFYVVWKGLQVCPTKVFECECHQMLDHSTPTLWAVRCLVTILFNLILPKRKFFKTKSKLQLIQETKLSVKSPSLSSPIPSFSGWYLQSKKFLLNLSMKCWNSAFNAQGSRVIIVVGIGRSNENICSNTEGALEKGKTRWNSSSHQNWWKN
jgi:hypothetical protein